MGRSSAAELLSSDEVTYCRMWQHGLDAIHERLRPYARRRDTHHNVMTYLDTLLLDVERKNGWQMAERAGLSAPHVLQHVLDRARWDETGVRAELLPYLAEQLGTEELVLVLDETGFVKKGKHSVGVQRQYCGTAGRIENCQVAVFLAWCTPTAHALLDVALYLPKSWTDAPERLQAAKVPDGLKMRTKPALGETLLKTAFDQGVRPAWVAADVVYGTAAMRRLLQEHQQPYILGVKASHKWILEGRSQTVGEFMASFGDSHWQRVSAGLGVQGPRFHDWFAVSLPWLADEGFGHWLLARKQLGSDELAFFTVFAKRGTSLEEIAWACGQRWGVEECFEEAKGLVGLDEFEVRSYHGFYRHMTLCCWAYAFLTAQRQRTGRPPSSKGGSTSNSNASLLPLD